MAIMICLSIVIAKKRSEMNLALAKKEALEKEVALLKKRNMELHWLRDSLIYDPVEVEKVAREQLGYSKPKEKLYKRYNFRVVNAVSNRLQTGYETAGNGESVIKKIGLFGILTLVVVGVTGIFYATYWYECKYRGLHS